MRTSAFSTAHVRRRRDPVELLVAGLLEEGGRLPVHRQVDDRQAAGLARPPRRRPAPAARPRSRPRSRRRRPPSPRSSSWTRIGRAPRRAGPSCRLPSEWAGVPHRAPSTIARNSACRRRSSVSSGWNAATSMFRSRATTGCAVELAPAPRRRRPQRSIQRRADEDRLAAARRRGPAHVAASASKLRTWRPKALRRAVDVRAGRAVLAVRARSGRRRCRAPARPDAANSRSGSLEAVRPRCPCSIVVLSPPGITSRRGRRAGPARRTSTGSAPSRSSARAWASKSPWIGQHADARPIGALCHAGRCGRRHAAPVTSATRATMLKQVPAPGCRRSRGRASPRRARLDARAIASGSSKCVVASTIAARPRGRVRRLEDARADEDALGAELHHQRGVGRRGEPAGGEVDDRQPARRGHLAHQLERRAQLLGGRRQLGLVGSGCSAPDARR